MNSYVSFVYYNIMTLQFNFIPWMDRM